MAESYSVKARLSAVDSGFTSTLKSAVGAVGSLGSSLKGGLGLGILQGVGQKAFSVISSGISSMVGEIDSSNAAWKTFASNMQIAEKNGIKLEGSIDSIKGDLQDFAQKTVYGASDMAQTYAQLASVGTKGTKKLVMGFGGLAAAAENPQQAMKTLSQQATQMAAKPTVAWQDFKLMLEQTPAGMAAVAKHMGMTSAELVTAIQDGEVATEDFFAAISEVGNSKDFYNMATQAKTMGQAMDGLTETLSNKLTPAWDVLSQVGIKAISSVSDALGGIDGQAVAANLSGWIKSAKPMWDSFANAASKVWAVVSGVAKKLQPIFNQLKGKIGSSIQGILDKIGAIDVDAAVSKISTGIMKAKPYFDVFVQIVGWVKDAVVAVLPYIAKIGNFFLDNSGTISKCIPYILGLVGAFKGFNIIKAVVPGMASFAKSIASMVSGGISSLAGKLFGVAKGTDATGKAAGRSSKQMLASAKAFLMIGAGVLMASAGFALLAQSAIALAAAGWPAIAVMGGLVIALAALMIGTLAFINTLSLSAAKMTAAGTAMLLLGAAVLMIGAGFALLAQSAIALAAAGWPAIAVMVGLVAAIALLAVGASIVGPALAAASIGFIAFGAAILMCGVGAILAATSLVILATVLPTLAACGTQGAVAILALGGALLVFGAGALVAGAGALVLGAGLLVVAAAIVVAAAGFLILSVGALLTAASLAILAAVLPLIATYGTQGAMAITLLGASMMVFAIGAGLAGAAAVLLSVGLLAACVGLAVAAVTIGLLAAGMTLLAVSTLLAAAGFGVIGAAILTILAGGMAAALVLTQMNLPLLAFVPAATVAGAAALVLAGGFAALAIATAALGIAMLALGAGFLLVGVGAAVAAGGLALLSLALPFITANAMQNTIALALLSSGLLMLGAGAAVAGAAAALAAIAMLALLAAATVTGVAVMLFGTFAMVASVGLLLMATALKTVQSSMSSIAKNATKAKKALDSMQDSVSIVEAGLKGLGKLAEKAMDGVANAFKGAAADARSAGQEVAQGFTSGMQIIVVMAPAVALMGVAATNAALMTGQSGAYQAGAFISIGFANGMLSMLGTIRSAANKIVKEANRAIEAKAKIGSPSKVTTQYGEWYGEGYGNGIFNMARYVWKAAENLVSIPNVKTPDLAMAYDGGMSSEYAYYRNADYMIEVPLTVDGKEFARATAHYNEAELNRRNLRDSRKHGIV